LIIPKINVYLFSLEANITDKTPVKDTIPLSKNTIFSHVILSFKLINDNCSPGVIFTKENIIEITQKIDTVSYTHLRAHETLS
jgi:hypothetical protein